jgi:hypothetical protein
LRHKGTHLLQHFLDHEARRNDALRFAQLHACQSLIELRRQRAEPLEIVIAIARREQAMGIAMKEGNWLCTPKAG